MSSKTIGDKGEDEAVRYLIKKQYKIVDRNWRNRWCEIDIVAKCKNIMYFVEVKYRKSVTWGVGLDSITPTKLKKMQFAAENWVLSNDWDGDYRLAAISIGPDNIELIEI